MGCAGLTIWPHAQDLSRTLSRKRSYRFLEQIRRRHLSEDNSQTITTAPWSAPISERELILAKKVGVMYLAICHT
jgi:hypothetical protein